MTQVAHEPGCTWRGCSEPATCSLGFGRFTRRLLSADYCEHHAPMVERLFRVESRTHAMPADLVPRYAHAREALEANMASVLVSL